MQCIARLVINRILMQHRAWSARSAISSQAMEMPIVKYVPKEKQPVVREPTQPKNVFVSDCIQRGIYEPPRDKTNKMTVRPAKTQISLIRVFAVRLMDS